MKLINGLIFLVFAVASIYTTANMKPGEGIYLFLEIVGAMVFLWFFLKDEKR